MFNQQTIKKWWQTFVGDQGFTEVRILGRYQYSGYFKSLKNLMQAIEPYSNMDDEQIYFVLNKIDDACYGRQQSEKIVKNPKITTNDNDIIRRQWIMCDFDPVRKSGVNASDQEYEYAHKKAQDVFRFLREKGFNDPVICKSGNGIHLNFKVDLPNDESTTDIIKRFFRYMGEHFSDDKVDFDQKNYNLARLCKLYSTTAKKGANLPERPWRESSIIYIPDDLKTTPIEKFKELADLVKDEPKSTGRSTSLQSQSPFSLVNWLDEHGVAYKEERQGESTRYTLEECPWIDQHSDRKKWDSALFLDPNGKITFNCHHSHCKNRTWHDVRTFYEPDAYNRPQYQPQVVYVQPAPQRTARRQYNIKEELPELGKKWLSLSDIKAADLTQLENVKTGFTELDKRIVGLYMSEVTILSGNNSSGKSSWLNMLILNIIEQGVKVALWTGELRADIYKTWFQMPAAGAHNMRPSQYEPSRYYVPDYVGRKIDEWTNGRFFVYNKVYGTKVEQILHDMEILLKADVRFFILDNLMGMDISMFEGDRNEKQKELILRIKDFAMEHAVHVILVAHPRKSLALLRKPDISGTADITNAVDNVFILHRTNDDFIRAVTEFYDAGRASALRIYSNVLSVEKNRMWGVMDYMCGMYYDTISRRFKNTEYEDVQYGWEVEPTPMTIDYDKEFTAPQPPAPQTAHVAPPVRDVITDNMMSDDGDCPF